MESENQERVVASVLDKHNITAAILTRDMGVAFFEIETLLNGDAVNEKTARQFIYSFGADEAARLIDWAAIGKKNPLTDKK